MVMRRLAQTNPQGVQGLFWEENHLTAQVIHSKQYSRAQIQSFGHKEESVEFYLGRIKGG